MNIFLRELRANLKSLLIWSGIVAVFTLVGYSKFSAYYNNPELLGILDTLPQGVVDAMGMNAFNLTTISGFFGIMIVYVSLMLSLAAAMWGAGVISKEERDKTVEFSLTLPVTRSRLITAKLAAMVVDCILLLLVTWGVLLVGARSYNPDAGYYKFVSVGMLSFFIVQMIFLALGFFLGCTLKKYKLASSLSIWILLGAYFLSILVGLDKNYENLKYLTPFKYFDAAQIFRDSSLQTGFVLLSLGIIVVLVGASYFTYSRRDMYI
jgi:ABC-2 type transport system permease protein